ncbi:MAG: hypothetical protein KC621_28790 [Myxococcales bacterium]|nr:hypothetical protein [Myxococcales bacterium]
MAEFLDRYESGCHDNAVDWAWVDEHCRVTDASCGYIAGNTGDPDWHVRQINQNASYDLYAQNQESAEQVCQQGGGTMVAYMVSGDGSYVGGWCMNLQASGDPGPADDDDDDYPEVGEGEMDMQCYDNCMSEPGADWCWCIIECGGWADCEEDEEEGEQEEEEEQFVDPLGGNDPCGPRGPALC